MFNPFKIPKYLKALNDYEKISKEVDMYPAKHLLLSKTFWVNLAQLGLDVGGIIPQKWQAPVFAVSNLILRLMSNQPISFTMDALTSGVQNLLKGGK